MERTLRRAVTALTAILAISVGIPAAAATVTSFVVLRSNTALSLTNPQAAAVTGSIRLLPAVGVSAPTAVAFTLAAGATQAFPGLVASLGTPQLPAIVAIDASDAITVSGAGVLPVAQATRKGIVPIHSMSGSLVVATLGGQVQVVVYEHVGSQVPLTTRTVSGSGESTQRLAIAALIPAGVSLSDAWASIEPQNGQAVAFVEAVPMRARAVRPAPISPALSVNGQAPCEFATGYTVTTPASNGSSYHWDFFNANVSGSTSNVAGFVLGTAGYATIALRETDARGRNDFSEVNLKVSGKATVSGLLAGDVPSGSTETIRWTTQTGTGLLTGTDFPNQGTAVDLSTGGYSYVSSTTGSKSVTLTPDGPCGSTSQTVSYSVVPACVAPNATVSAPSSAVAGSTFSASMPFGAASYSWSVTGGTIQSGQGSRSITVLVTAAAGGSVVVRGTASNGGGCTASDSASVSVTAPAPDGSISANPTTVAFFGPGSTLTVTVINGTSWNLVSSLGNPFGGNAGTGSGTFTVHYDPQIAKGNDTITLTIYGQNGQTITRTVHILVQ